MCPEAREPGVAENVLALEAEVARLNKIVDALMDRAEASLNAHGTDFGLFQTTVMLQDQVRLHTDALEASLRDGEADDGPRAVARDMQTLRRAAALQIQLLELVVQQKDMGELIDRVAAILDVPIVLFDMRGRVMHCSRSAAGAPDLAARLWREYREQRAAGAVGETVTAGDERILFREILVMDRPEQVLAAVTSRRRPSDLAGASLLFLQQLVTLDLLHSRDELRMRRRVRRGLLSDVVAGDHTTEELRVRLQEQGFDEESSLRIVVLETASHAGPQEGDGGAKAAGRRGTRLLHALDATLSQRRSPFLTSPIGSLAVVLTALLDDGTATARTLLADLRDAAAQVTSRGVVAGCSAPLSEIAAAPRALQQAKAACIAARREDQGGIAAFEELSGHFRLLDGLDEAALNDIVQRTFAPLLEFDARHRASLYETVRTLFEHRLAVQETADALHIHRNTLQKRLAHAEQLLGVDLSGLDAIVDIRLGLHAAELLGRPLP
jgi:sugar diacid utilization regulator